MNEFCRSWKFIKDDVNGAHLNSFDDATWNDVDIPHDWSVEGEFDQEKGEGCTGYLLGGMGWYRKTFVTTEEMHEKIVTLIFDGVYNNADFYMNGEYLGFHRNNFVQHTLYEVIRIAGDQLQGILAGF